MRATVKLGEHLWRPLTADAGDTEFVLSLRNNERFRHMFYQSSITPQMHADFIRKADERGEINFCVEKSGERVGLASIYNFDLRNRKCECGRVVMLDPRLFFASWIVSGFVVFDTMDLNRSYIETLEENQTIAHGVERMGMKREGVLRGHIVRNGKPLNIALYAILADEWRAVRDRHYERFGMPELIAFDGPRANQE